MIGDRKQGKLFLKDSYLFTFILSYILHKSFILILITRGKGVLVSLAGGYRNKSPSPIVHNIYT